MEEEIKLHMCAGDVYLEGYTNIDIDGHDSKKGYSDLFKENNKTTLSNYYKFTFGTKPRPFVIDKKMNILERWDYEDNSVDEVVMICAIEHFTPNEAKFIISEIHRVLKVEGVLRIDFPDICMMVMQYVNSIRPLMPDSDKEISNDFNTLMKYIYCNQKNEYSQHKWGYNVLTFSDLLNNIGVWDIQFKDIVKHAYPMIGCEAIKK